MKASAWIRIEAVDDEIAASLREMGQGPGELPWCFEAERFAPGPDARPGARPAPGVERGRRRKRSRPPVGRWISLNFSKRRSMRPYLLVGFVASSVYGEPRLTMDVVAAEAAPATLPDVFHSGKRSLPRSGRCAVRRRSPGIRLEGRHDRNRMSSIGAGFSPETAHAFCRTARPSSHLPRTSSSRRWNITGTQARKSACGTSWAS